jgi:hypothetical protein
MQLSFGRTGLVLQLHLFRAIRLSQPFQLLNPCVTFAQRGLRSLKLGLQEDEPMVSIRLVLLAAQNCLLRRVFRPLEIDLHLGHSGVVVHDLLLCFLVRLKHCVRSC